MDSNAGSPTAWFLTLHKRLNLSVSCLHCATSVGRLAGSDDSLKLDRGREFNNGEEIAKDGAAFEVSDRRSCYHP